MRGKQRFSGGLRGLKRTKMDALMYVCVGGASRFGLARTEFETGIYFSSLYLRSLLREDREDFHRDQKIS